MIHSVREDSSVTNLRSVAKPMRGHSLSEIVVSRKALPLQILPELELWAIRLPAQLPDRISDPEQDIKDRNEIGVTVLGAYAEQFADKVQTQCRRFGFLEPIEHFNMAGHALSRSRRSKTVSIGRSGKVEETCRV